MNGFTGLQSYQGQFLKLDLIIHELRERRRNKLLARLFAMYIVVHDPKNTPNIIGVIKSTG